MLAVVPKVVSDEPRIMLCSGGPPFSKSLEVCASAPCIASVTSSQTAQERETFPRAQGVFSNVIIFGPGTRPYRRSTIIHNKQCTLLNLESYIYVIYFGLRPLARIVLATDLLGSGLDGHKRQLVPLI